MGVIVVLRWRASARTCGDRGFAECRRWRARDDDAGAKAASRRREERNTRLRGLHGELVLQVLMMVRELLQGRRRSRCASDADDAGLAFAAGGLARWTLRPERDERAYPRICYQLLASAMHDGGGIDGAKIYADAGADGDVGA